MTVRLSSETGLEARARCVLTEDGKRYKPELIVTLDERGLHARLLTKRF